MSMLRQLAKSHALDIESAAQRLSWAARLHEIGLSIAHTGFHKHTAYIVEHADMPGFSKKEQQQLSRLTHTQRGSLSKSIHQLPDSASLMQIMSLRLAVLFYRSRMEFDLPDIKLEWKDSSIELMLSKGWIALNPLTASAFEKEAKEWKSIGLKLEISNL